MAACAIALVSEYHVSKLREIIVLYLNTYFLLQFADEAFLSGFQNVQIFLPFAVLYGIDLKLNRSDLFLYGCS